MKGVYVGERDSSGRRQGTGTFRWSEYSTSNNNNNKCNSISNSTRTNFNGIISQNHTNYNRDLNNAAVVVRPRTSHHNYISVDSGHVAYSNKRKNGGTNRSSSKGRGRVYNPVDLFALVGSNPEGGGITLRSHDEMVSMYRMGLEEYKIEGEEEGEIAREAFADQNSHITSNFSSKSSYNSNSNSSSNSSYNFGSDRINSHSLGSLNNNNSNIINSRGGAVYIGAWKGGKMSGQVIPKKNSI